MLCHSLAPKWKLKQRQYRQSECEMWFDSSACVILFESEKLGRISTKRKFFLKGNDCNSKLDIFFLLYEMNEQKGKHVKCLDWPRYDYWLLTEGKPIFFLAWLSIKFDIINSLSLIIIYFKRFICGAFWFGAFWWNIVFKLGRRKFIGPFRSADIIIHARFH